MFCCGHDYMCGMTICASRLGGAQTRHGYVSGVFKKTGPRALRE